MKTFFDRKNPKTLALSLVALMLLTITFSSCKKDHTNVKAFVMVTNSAQSSAPQDFYIDNAKVNSSAVAYGQTSGFLEVNGGDRQAAFKSSGTATVNSSFNFTLAGGQYYDVFFTDDNSYSAAAIDRSPAPADKAKIRFINLSSALTSNVDFGISGGDKLVSSLSYKVASSYYNVDPAKTFAIYASGSASALLSIPATIQAGHIYTIYVSGASNATLTFHAIAEN